MTAVPHAVIGVPGIEWRFQNPRSGSLVAENWCLESGVAPHLLQTPAVSSILTLSFVSTRTHHGLPDVTEHERAESEDGWPFDVCLSAPNFDWAALRLRCLFHYDRPGLP
jgi:hypothetical protein